MEHTAPMEQIQAKLGRLIDAFCPLLYEDDEIFLQNMKERSLAGDDIRRYQHWEWTQGVGLYGLWKLFARTKDPQYLDILTRFYDSQLEIALAALKNAIPEEFGGIVQDSGKIEDGTIDGKTVPVEDKKSESDGETA